MEEGAVTAVVRFMVEEAFAEEAFAEEAFTEEAFTEEAFTQEAFAGEAFADGVTSGAFTVTAFSFPVSASMGTPGGGIGVIPIIGAILITHIHMTPGHTTVTMRTMAIRPTEPVMPTLPLRWRCRPNSPGAAITAVPLTAS